MDEKMTVPKICAALNAASQQVDAQMLATVSNVGALAGRVCAARAGGLPAGAVETAGVPNARDPQRKRGGGRLVWASLTRPLQSDSHPNNAKVRPPGPLDPPAEHLGNVLEPLRLGAAPLFATLTLGECGRLVSRMPMIPPTPAAELLLSDEHMDGIFETLDRDGDGCLSAADIADALVEFGLPCSGEYYDDVLAQYDAEREPGDESGLTRESFSNHLAKRRRRLWAAFEKLDVDGSGSLCADDLAAALGAAGLPADQDGPAKMVALLASQQRGEHLTVSFQDFCRYAGLLPAEQLNNSNTIFCWMDSADWVFDMERRLGVVPPKQPYQRLFAGGIAGALSRTMVAPAERLRTIIMTTAGNAGMRESFRVMWADGGFLGMFRGNLATVIKVMPASALQFAAYDNMKDAIKRIWPRPKDVDLTSGEKLLAGCLAGAVSSVFTYPLETIRTWMSIPGAVQGGLVEAAKHLWETQGPKGFYRGFGSCVASDIVASGAGFTVYEMGQKLFYRLFGRVPRPSEKGIVGGLSAICVMTITMPFEVVMRRLQIQGTAGNPILYKGTIDCFRQIATQEGIRAFYKGSLSSYLKVAPSIGATYAVYDLLSHRWAIDGLRRYKMTEPLREPVEA